MGGHGHGGGGGGTGVLVALTPFLSALKGSGKSRPDTISFKLHYKITTTLLLVLFTLTMLYSFFDKNDSAINCTVDVDHEEDHVPLVPLHIINDYCWITGTFTLPKYFKGNKGKDFISYGVGPMEGSSMVGKSRHKYNDFGDYGDYDYDYEKETESEKIIVYRYYQWVGLILFLQAIMFYIPHYIWKVLEISNIDKIVVTLNNHLKNSQSSTEAIEEIENYLNKRLQVKSFRWYGLTLLICEILNFINVIGQMCLVDRFLDGTFWSYGFQVMGFDYEEQERLEADENGISQADPMDKIFPTMTKCEFHKYGPSGTIERYDALCVMGINILNRKTYLFLWFWFIILAIFTGGFIIYRFVMCFKQDLRMKYITQKKLKVILENNEEINENFFEETDFVDDWIILDYLQTKLTSLHDASKYKQLLTNLKCIKFNKKHSNIEVSNENISI